ncbi:unnamed protein product [Alternaria alternata]
MALYTDEFLDTSGYTPSSSDITELKEKLRSGHARSLPSAIWAETEDSLTHTHNEGRSDEHPTLQLSLDDLRELEQAFDYFNSTGLSLNQLQAEHFPLPSLSHKIRQFSVLLPTTQPYFIVRGIRSAWFSKYKNVVIFTGLASHAGTKRALAPGDPNVLHHVANLEADGEGGKMSFRGPANRSAALPFHTDYGSILSFYVLSTAASGGNIRLANIDDILAELVKRRPDLVETLRQPFTLINAKEEGAFDQRPLLFTLPSGRTAIQASRSRLFGTACRPRPDSLPPLSSQQTEAVNALHVIGDMVAKCVECRSGDMLFFNNCRMMHARDAFIDGDDNSNTTKRYLLRLILDDDRDDAPWELPPELLETWKELYDHRDEDEVFAIHPELFSYKCSH